MRVDFKFEGHVCDTVDGRNPAPFDMVNIPLFTGLYICHQQYYSRITGAIDDMSIFRHELDDELPWEPTPGYWGFKTHKFGVENLPSSFKVLVSKGSWCFLGCLSILTRK